MSSILSSIVAPTTSNLHCLPPLHFLHHLSTTTQPWHPAKSMSHYSNVPRCSGLSAATVSTLPIHLHPHAPYTRSVMYQRRGTQISACEKTVSKNNQKSRPKLPSSERLTVAQRLSNCSILLDIVINKDI